MMEFITPMTMWALDGTQGNEANCAAVQRAIADFETASGIKAWKGDARPHASGCVFVSIEFEAKAESPQFFVKRQREIMSAFTDFLAKRGYKLRLL